MQQPKSFRFKIFLLFFSFAVVICVVLGVVLYSISSRSLIQKMCESMDNNLQTASYNFDSMLRSANDIGAQLALDEEVMESLPLHPEKSGYDYLVLSQEMRQRLNRAKYGGSMIKSLYIVSSDGESFYKSQIDRTFTPSEIKSTEWYRLLPQARENTWYLLGQDNLVEWVPEPTLTSVKPIRSRSMTRIIGYVVVNISMSSIRAFFEEQHFGSSGYMLVYNAEEKLIFHPDASLEGKSEENILPQLSSELQQDSILLSDALITYRKALDSGLSYGAYIPIEEVIGPANAIRSATILLLALCFCTAFLYAMLITRQIFAPIRVLVEHMERAGDGDTGIQITDARRDEMGILYRSFNRMTKRISQLITKLCTQETLTKELQLENLQIQLNPHFLYNMLDAIHWAAREDDMEDVCRMTFLLSAFFRKSLNDGKDFIQVEEAAAIAESYLELQKIRHVDKLEYSVTFQPELRAVMVRKYLFQPLIENAVLHGIEKKSGRGFCRVHWELEGQKIRFTVEDDGKGIPSDQLENLQELLKKEDTMQTGSFALRNIAMQLRLFYGEDCQLILSSRLNEGTQVSFLIPMEKRGYHVQDSASG